MKLYNFDYIPVTLELVFEREDWYEENKRDFLTNFKVLSFNAAELKVLLN